MAPLLSPQERIRRAEAAQAEAMAMGPRPTGRPGVYWLATWRRHVLAVRTEARLIRVNARRAPEYKPFVERAAELEKWVEAVAK